jgi:hypothetical protein
LVSYRWVNPKATDGLEIYTLKPVKVTADNPSSFPNLNSFTSDSPSVTVTGTGSIMFDFGVESAAWLEFDSPDLTDSDSVEMSISEYNEPAVVNAGAQNHVKTLAPVKYGNTYRLELNKELYEGVRFGWIHVRKFDQQFLAVADGLSHWVYSYQIAHNGTLTNKEHFFWLQVQDWENGSGAQSVCYDKEGHLYVATRSGIQIHTWDGPTQVILPLPGEGGVSSICFGGPNVDEIFAFCVDKVYKRVYIN